MKRPLILISFTGFWLLMTSLLVYKEFFQLSAIQSQYEVLPIHLEEREEYNAILMGKERIGFNFTVLQALKDNPKGTYELRHQTLLNFLFLGQPRQMLVRGNAKLDQKFFLNEFEVTITSDNYKTKISGKKRSQAMDLVIESSGDDPIQKTVPLKNPILHSEASRFIWTSDNLKVGKKGSFETWNPLMNNAQRVEFHVLEKTQLDHDGKKVEVYAIHIVAGGIEIRSWVNPEGVVLKEESLAGLTTLKQEGWQIFDAMRKEKSNPPDLPNLFSIPSDQKLKNVENLKTLKIKIKTPAEEKNLTFNQVSLKGLEIVPYPFDAAEFKASLEATEWIESDDEEIKNKAKEIAGETVSTVEAVQKLLDWTHKNISPVPSMTIPKAKQVLASRKGDCNEYAVLFTALARSLGIPTRMIAGLVYQNGRFFYHAWSEVFVGKWVTADPTFHQFPADVTHIPLVEGSVEDQIALVTQLGQIKISILDKE